MVPQPRGVCFKLWMMKSSSSFRHSPRSHIVDVLWNSEPDSRHQFSSCFWSAFLIFRKMRFWTKSADTTTQNIRWKGPLFGEMVIHVWDIAQRVIAAHASYHSTPYCTVIYTYTYIHIHVKRYTQKPWYSSKTCYSRLWRVIQRRERHDSLTCGTWLIRIISPHMDVALYDAWGMTCHKHMTQRPC